MLTHNPMMPNRSRVMNLEIFVSEIVLVFSILILIYIYIYISFNYYRHSDITFCGSCKGVGLAGWDEHNVGSIPPRRSANAGAGEAKSINSRTGLVR